MLGRPDLRRIVSIEFPMPNLSGQHSTKARFISKDPPGERNARNRLFRKGEVEDIAV